MRGRYIDLGGEQQKNTSSPKVFHATEFGIEMPCIICNTEKVEISTLRVASEDKINVHLRSQFTHNMEWIELPLIR